MQLKTYLKIVTNSTKINAVNQELAGHPYQHPNQNSLLCVSTALRSTPALTAVRHSKVGQAH